MSGVLDRIRAQGARDRRGTVEIPEWGEPGRPLVIHFRPPTLNDAASVMKTAGDDVIRQNVEIFCMVSQNEDGSPMFRRLDVLTLMEAADPDVLGRVMREMGIIRQAPDDIEKN